METWQFNDKTVMGQIIMSINKFANDDEQRGPFVVACLLQVPMSG